MPPEVKDPFVYGPRSSSSIHDNGKGEGTICCNLDHAFLIWNTMSSSCTVYVGDAPEDRELVFSALYNRRTVDDMPKPENFDQMQTTATAALQ